MITLKCMRPEDGFKTNVRSAFFYRNGVVENTDDPCLQGRSGPSGRHHVYLTPECEGYFMCATVKIVGRDGYEYHIVSSALALHGTLSTT